MDQLMALVSFRNGSVCWVERNHKVVQRGGARMRCASVLRMEETYQLPEPDLLSYAGVVEAVWDWAGGNWYFLDSVQEAVFLCRWKPDQGTMKCWTGGKSSRSFSLTLRARVWGCRDPLRMKF